MLHKLIARIYLHFWHHRQREAIDYIWRISLESLAISIIVSLVIFPFIEIDNGSRYTSFYYFFILAVIAAPLIETALLQAIPITLARGFKLNFSSQVGMSVVPFAILHFWISPVAGFSAGIIGGFYLAFSYAHWVQQSTLLAYIITASVHVLSNGILFVSMFLIDYAIT